MPFRSFITGSEVQTAYQGAIGDTIAGNLAVGGTLDVTGNATFSGTFGVTGVFSPTTIMAVDTTTPSIETQSGKTNTGFLGVKGKTSGEFKITTADATAQTITLAPLAQTSGAATLAIPDLAGVGSTVLTKVTSSGNIDESANTGTFKTPTGTNTLGGNTIFKAIPTPVAATGAGGGVAGAAALGAANQLYVSSDGATKGVKLLTGVAGDLKWIINTSGTACNLFAASGGTINGGGADVGCAIPASKGVVAFCSAADTWTVFDMPAHAGAAA